MSDEWMTHEERRTIIDRLLLVTRGDDTLPGTCALIASVYHDAIKAHHGQKADDRCVLDDDTLYAAAGLPPVDRRVGDKFAMAQNCMRYIERRCEGGHWPSYADLEAELVRWRAVGSRLMETLDLHDVIEELERLTGKAVPQ